MFDLAEYLILANVLGWWIPDYTGPAGGPYNTYGA